MLFCVVFAFVSCFALWGCSGRIAIPILSAWTCARGNFPSSISGSGHSFYFLFILVFNGITIGPESEESEPDLGPRSLELSAAICSAFFHAQAPGSLQAPQPMHSNFCRLEILFLALSRFGLVQSSPAHSSSRLRDFWGPFVHVRLSYTWCPACSLLLPPVGPHVLQCKHFVVIAAPAAVTSSPNVFCSVCRHCPFLHTKNSSLSFSRVLLIPCLALTSLFWDRSAVGAVHFAPIKHLYVPLSLAPPRFQVHGKSAYLTPSDH